jgi:hypothetical protein
MQILVNTDRYVDALRDLVERARDKVLQPLSCSAGRVMQVEVYGDQNANPGGLRTCDFACTGSCAAGIPAGTFEVAVLDGRPLLCRGSCG